MVQESNTQHELRFGYSTKIKYFQSFSEKIERSWYMLLTVLGTASFTYAGGFASGAPNFITKEVGKEWAWADTVQAEGMMSMMEVIWVLICHPYMHFFYAIVLLALGLSGTSKDYENLQTTSDQLKRNNRALITENNNLKSVVEASEVENATLNGKMQAKHAQLVTTWLNGAFTQLLGINTNARVSIYYYYNDAFYILARFSPNGDIGNIHNQKFPRNKGVISQVYKRLICHEKDVPDHKSCPDEHKKYMIDTYKYAAEQLDNFNMKSCRYFGQAIREADSVIGIILYESDNPEDLVEEQLIARIKDYNKNYWSHLCQFVRHGLEFDLSAKRHENSNAELDALQELGGRQK
ncbi:hypothetical protein BCT26_22075 [Vibrio lentus]|uniref:hypothetical protein n=1 Tax=Vibrio lentus TaxID=136468 RepID=UPI000C82DD7C|nr:hypothetical protein [Vibrio lentus]PMN72306.1 hypothetical protein BCT26_22075 [Vibrio lentus]